MGDFLAYFMLDLGGRKETATAVEKFHPNPEANTGLQEATAPSALLRFIDLSRAPAHGQNSLRFIAGTALIAGSFLVYLAYPVILLYLPFSGSVKVGATVAVWVLSWGVFSAGIFLTGPQGYEWLKGLWTGMTGGDRGKRAGQKYSRSNSETPSRAREPSTRICTALRRR
jgi:hypothetical protein